MNTCDLYFTAERGDGWRRPVGCQLQDTSIIIRIDDGRSQPTAAAALQRVRGSSDSQTH